MTTKIELLAHSKDLTTAIAAIDHGADAVYIGAADFSARKAAANSIEDIALAVEYAHKYHVRVYVALNTIIAQQKLPAAQKLIHQLHQAGADAIIVQDMSILEMDLPPIGLHSSTQTDNRTAEKVDFLYQAGFSRVVLARELSLEQISEIHSKTKAELEVFVHGALCVSYSGQCYLSQTFCSRSANKGQCAQICRLPFDLSDSEDNIIERQKHLLSLKDLDQSSYLEQIIDAGARSLKIEGRLKDISYVKNTTAYYRRLLDDIFRRRTDFERSSHGISQINFEPNPAKSFNRGTTNYFINGRSTERIFNPITPKSIGEKIGTVTSIGTRSLKVDTTVKLSNADGFCFTDSLGRFQGFRVDKAEGDILYPTSMPNIRFGTTLYRNYNHAFETIMKSNTATRTIPTTLTLDCFSDKISLRAEDECGFAVTVEREGVFSAALKPQSENIIRELSKTGGSEFSVSSTTINSVEELFVPNSVLSAIRREVLQKLSELRKSAALQKNIIPRSHPAIDTKKLDFSANVYNDLAQEFYKKCGVEDIEPAFELQEAENGCIATSKHCIKHSLGICPKNSKFETKIKEPLYLRNSNIAIRLEFDCRECQMKMYKA